MHKVATAENFRLWETKYTTYTSEQLARARHDAFLAAQAQPDDAGYYYDEISVIIREQNRREKNRPTPIGAARLRRNQKY